MEKKKNRTIFVQVNNTREFLRMFLDDPNTVYPVTLCTKSMVRIDKAGYTECMQVIRTPEEFEEAIEMNRNLIAQYPVRFRRHDDGTGIDLATGGRLELTESEIEELGLFEGKKLSRIMPADKDTLQTIYDNWIGNIEAA